MMWRMTFQGQEWKQTIAEGEIKDGSGLGSGRAKGEAEWTFILIDLPVMSSPVLQGTTSSVHLESKQADLRRRWQTMFLKC